MLNRTLRSAVLIFLVGVGVGLLLNNTDLVEALTESFITVLDEHGLAVAISFMFVISSVSLVMYLLKVTIKSKDEEIKRLVKLRNELWDEYIKERPRSGAKDKP